MWQRYNQGSHIFEKSLDNGASWVPMPINASSLEGTAPPGVVPPLPENIAYTDRQNTFGHRQFMTSVGGDLPTPYYALEIIGGPVIGGDHAGIVLHATNQPVDQKKWRILTYATELWLQPLIDSEAGTNSSGLILTRGGDAVVGRRLCIEGQTGAYAALRGYSVANPAGLPMIEVVQADNGNWAGVRASNFIAMGSYNNFPDLTCGATNFYSGVTCTGGNITCNGYIGTAGDFRSGGPMYPGRYDASWSQQLVWYLASHASYGLWSNTGLYLGGSLTVAGGGSFGGSLTFPANVWHLSNDGIQRIYFGWGSHTYIKSYANIYFRGGNTDTEILTIFAGGEVQTPGGVKAMAFGCKPGMYAAPTGSWFNFNWTGNVQVWIDATYVGDIVFSDSRLKRDFTPLTSSLDKVLKMRPGSFYFRDGVDAAPRLRLGLQAQELIEVAPELVRQTDLPTELTPDGTYQIDYNGMIPMLVSAMQELEQRVSRLE